MAVAKEQIRQIISENNINSVADKEDIPEIFRMLPPTVFILARIWEHWEMREL